MKRNPSFIIAVVLVSALALAAGLLLPRLLPAPETAAEQEAAPVPDQVLETGLGDVGIFYTETARDWGTEERRVYELPNGDRFTQVRLTFAEKAPAQEIAVDEFRLPLGSLLRRYDAAEETWRTGNPPQASDLPCGQYYLSFGDFNVMAVGPQVYRPQARQMLEHLPESDGVLRLQPLAEDEGWQVSFSVSVLPGGQAEYFYLTSAADILPLGDPEAMSRWAGYDLTGDNRWCWTGYYYRTPYNYIPSGDNYYHRLSAAYIAVKCAKQEDRACTDLALAMLHVMLDLQNEAGYFPTVAESQWLRDDYGVGAGFYDTRFNSDLVLALLVANEKYDVPEFAQAAAAYGQFYLDLVREHHHTLTAADGTEYWLAWDYYHPDGCLPSHCSLNHQVAEIRTLFRLYDLTEDEEYEELAQQLLGGIFTVGEDWILPDGDLNYAYLPDGSMGMQDYMYLTYNDLFYLRNELDQRYGEHDPVLDRIMSAKLGWMQANGVSGYKE